MTERYEMASEKACEIIKEKREQESDNFLCEWPKCLRFTSDINRIRDFFVDDSFSLREKYAAYKQILAIMDEFVQSLTDQNEKLRYTNEIYRNAPQDADETMFAEFSDFARIPKMPEIMINKNGDLLYPNGTIAERSLNSYKVRINGKEYYYYSLIGETFLERDPVREKKYIACKDGDICNVELSNLYWCTWDEVTAVLNKKKNNSQKPLDKSE